MSGPPCQTTPTNNSWDGSDNSSVLPSCGQDQASSSGYSGRRPPKECGSCNGSCVYKVIEMGFVIGIIANILVITLVIKDRKLRDSTFVAIAALAVADLLFLSINLTVSFEAVFMIVNCSSSQIIGRPYYILSNTFWFAANAHVSLLAILRYITLAYPLRANSLLTPKRVMKCSGIVWLVGFTLIGTLSLLIQLKIIVTAGRSKEYILYLWSVVYLMPLLITIVLHVMKIRKVKLTTQHSATDYTRKSIKRMSKIVVMVIICAAVLPFPNLISKILRSAGHSPTGDLKTHYEGIAHLMFLINNFINPFVYGFLSKRFRTSLKQTLSCLLCFSCVSVSFADNSAETVDTPLTSRKASIEIGLDRLDIKQHKSNQNLADIDLK